MAQEDDSTTVKLTVHYREEPGLGSLAYDLLEVDRGFRSALREAPAGEPPPGRSGWPRLTASPRIIRASANSPLAIEASTLVQTIFATAVGGLIATAIANRLSKRPRDAQSVQITINVDNRQYTTVEVNGNRTGIESRDGEGAAAPEDADGEDQGPQS